MDQILIENMFWLVVTSCDLTACGGGIRDPLLLLSPTRPLTSSLSTGFPHREEDVAMPQQSEDPSPSRRPGLASLRLQTLKPGHSFP